MFKNKAIQFNLVEKPNKATDGVSETDFNDKATVVAVVVESAIKKVAFAVAGYVVLDTVRKVMVISAMKGIKE